MSTPTAPVSDFIVNSVEAIEVYDADGELDGYALVATPSWYRGGPHYSDAAYDRLVATDPTPLTPVRSTRSGAWSDVAQVRYVAGTGVRYFPEPKAGDQ